MKQGKYLARARGLICSEISFVANLEVAIAESVTGYVMSIPALMYVVPVPNPKLHGGYPTLSSIRSGYIVPGAYKPTLICS